MREGWNNEDYLLLFDEGEIAATTKQYELQKNLQGYEIVGLKSWDDFILRDRIGKLFTIPIVPLDLQYLAPADLDFCRIDLTQDPRVAGKIKWYTKPIIFGGSPSSEENMIWVPLETHIQLVKWWNNLYQEMQRKS